MNAYDFEMITKLSEEVRLAGLAWSEAIEELVAYEKTKAQFKRNEQKLGRHYFKVESDLMAEIRRNTGFRPKNSLE